MDRFFIIIIYLIILEKCEKLLLELKKVIYVIYDNNIILSH